MYLPRELAARLDEAARSEMRSRANAAAWLIEQGLRRREPVEVVEPGEAG